MKKGKTFEHLELKVEFCSLQDSYRATHTIALVEPIATPTGDFLLLVKNHWGDSLPILAEGILTLMCVNSRAKTFSLVVRCYLPPAKLRSAKIDSVLVDIL